MLKKFVFITLYNIFSLAIDINQNYFTFGLLWDNRKLIENRILLCAKNLRNFQANSINAKKSPNVRKRNSKRFLSLVIKGIWILVRIKS